MLTRLIVKNFKQFGIADIELGNPVVFVGPNNSGKTTALQALALWEIGVRRWVERRGGKAAPAKRPGVTINRRDLITVPVPHANLLWRHLHCFVSEWIEGSQKTTPVFIEITVEGIDVGTQWSFGLEFYYANEESFYCRPQRVGSGTAGSRQEVPEAAGRVRIGFLPPMSGLASNEVKLETGAIQVRLGEGRTAEVLRNLCHQLRTAPQGEERWSQLADQMEQLFGVRLDEPNYIAERGEIAMTYEDADGVQLDISSAGRGLQQTLLLLAYIGVNPPGTVLLLDEPDAHLEFLRQRQVYKLLTEAARESGAQIVAASHSEVVLNEAADRDVVVAFLGRPHRIDDRGSQLLKSLKEIGFEQYYQAEQTGWVLYLEGSTDLAILQGLAHSARHHAREVLERPFVHYVLNQPSKARDHYFGLREAKPDLVGIAIYDRLEQQLPMGSPLSEQMWGRREIENYLCLEAVLNRWAFDAGRREGGGELFAATWAKAMEQSVSKIGGALQVLGKSPWSADTKVTNEFLDPLFKDFFERLHLPNLLRKTDYHVLARFVEPNEIDPEVIHMLDLIVDVARTARPIT